jgi:electron transfer flavoprotein beta subunit
MAWTMVVLLKQVPDMNAARIDRATGQPVFSGQQVISSFDEYAIEAALQIKEAHGGEVIAVSAGPQSVKDALTRALAMGADRAISIELDQAKEIDTLGVAEVLAEAIRGLSADIIFTGQNSDDYATGQIGPQVAELLGVPQVSSVAGLDVMDKRLRLIRDTEDGKQIVEVDAPVLIMAMTGLNSPRYPSLKGIMAAKKKPTDSVEGKATTATNVTWGEPFVQEKSASGTIVQDVDAVEAARQLVAWLQKQKLI